MTAVESAKPDLELQGYARRGYILVGVIAVTVLGWGGLARISGAVVAPGRVVVESSVKRVQHREGGIVSAIMVREGDEVKAGQVVARLDSTVPNANAAVVENQLEQLTARKLRLEAERDGKARLSPQSPPNTPQIAAILASEQSLLLTRRNLADQRKAQLREQIVQSQDEIVGLRSQVAAQSNQARLIQGELVGMRELRAKGYAPLAKVNQLERESERLGGAEGELTSRIARAKTRMAEIRVQMLQVDTERLNEVMSDLKDTEIRLAQLTEQKVAADDEVRRVDVRAPAAGFVQQLAVHARGAVVAPGETLMIVVPKEDALIVEARIDPQHIDQVPKGRPARVRFTSFAAQTTPELTGRVDGVSADATTDERTGQSFYAARLRIDPGSLPASLRGRLVPGMPAEVHIETGRRNALSYFLKPLTDQLERTFRED